MIKTITLMTIVCMLCCFKGFSEQTTITFNVDMNGLGFRATDTTLNVRVKGDVAPLNWVTGIQLTDRDHDGIYSAVVAFNSKTKQELTYKYVLNDIEWELGDNYKLTIGSENKTLQSKFRYNKRPANPFQKFIGEWTLKDDNWEQGYNNKIDIVKIPGHHTSCKEVNTDNSLLWIIEAPNSKGHIFWSFNSSQKRIQWSSNFYSYRSGSGEGGFSDSGDILFKVIFEGEPSGAYGIYTYRWVSNDEFVLKSVQYDAEDKPTGATYGGTFIRLSSKGNN